MYHYSDFIIGNRASMLEMASFIGGTAILAFISRASLRVPESHGFYRFLAWELMLVLVVMNLDGWYDAPPSLTQTICGILMGASLLLAITSYLTLHQFGQQDDGRNDTPLLRFEKTTMLVEHGIYRHIRHPMYSSLILLDWGLFFKQPTWLSGGIATIACILMVIAALAEEKENVRYFGEQYREYMTRTLRFMPFFI
ncbi:MAG: isoprenylcysteine carboxylmethyltransferase family protein [Gallionellaceae bacterium]|nr:isoprenylcysteine carboxylmethyltransferase family protein [Gallionellaceae bacterium]